MNSEQQDSFVGEIGSWINNQWTFGILSGGDHGLSGRFLLWIVSCLIWNGLASTKEWMEGKLFWKRTSTG